MTTQTIINFITNLLVLLFVIYGLSWLIYKTFFQKKDDTFKSKLKTFEIFLILLSIGLIFFSISAPFILTRESASQDLNFIETGQIGDTIGGLMSPFINLSAVIVTGLAFYMQYRANQLQIQIFREEIREGQEQFRIEQEKQDKDAIKQQFESQFYEMLRLHKENVNEIEIDAKRRIVSTEQKQEPMRFTFNLPLGIFVYTYNDYIITKRNAFVQMQYELEFMIEKLKKSETVDLTFEVFQKLYEIFFWGLNTREILDKDPDLKSKKIESILLKIRNNQYSEKISEAEILPFEIAAFKGHSNFLGHYYRHLFHTVKFVANYDESILKKNEKKNYLRLLRAQLSNHEQALLFYNWLAKYGGAWQDDNNNFLTEYRMIHNLWYGDLPQKPFITKKLHELVTKYKQLGHKDDLFEMGDSKILNS